MTERLDDVWTSRDYPVLLEVARRFDQGADLVQASDLVEDTGLSEDDIRLALAALERRELVGKPVRVMDGRPGLMAVCKLAGSAYLMTGLHPDGDDALSRLIDGLRQAAEQTADESERGRLRQAADALAGIARDVGVGVLTAVIAGGA